MAAGCQVPQGQADSVRLIDRDTCEKTFELLKTQLREDNYESAHVLFTEEFCRQRAPGVKDLMARASIDRGKIIAGVVHEEQQEYDTGKTIVSYGDKFIYIYYTRVDDMWLITTKDHYNEVKDRSTPEKILYKTAKLIARGQFHSGGKYFTPYAWKALCDPATRAWIQRSILFFFRGETQFRRTGHWAEGLSKLTVRRLDPDGEMQERVFRLKFSFVRREDKWLIAAEDEWEWARELHGDE